MAVPSPSRRRTRDPAAKHDAIHEAALTLFSRSGFEAVTVADIANEARVAVGTVYRLYPNKIALLQTLHQSLEQRFVDRMRAGWDPTRRHAERFLGLCTALFDLIDEERQRLSILAMTTDIASADGSLPGDAVRAEIAAMIQVGIEQGAFRRDDPSLLAAIAYGMVDGAMRAWLRNPTQSGRNSTVIRLSQMMRDAIVR